MPNIIRNQVFQEFALETTKDSIKYCRPFWSKTANGHTLNDRDPNYDPFNSDADYDPWDYENGDASFNGDTFRKALYEDTRDRANQELANGIVVASENGTVGTEQATVAAGGSEIALVFDADTAQKLAISDNAKFEAGKWGAAGKNLIDGYTVIYGVNADDKGPNTEQQLIAMQDTRSGQFFSAPGFTVELVKAANVRDKFLTPSKSGVNQFPGTTELADVLKTTGVYVVQITPDADVATKAPWFKAGETKVAAFARYTSEGDFEGNYLGEVEIALTDYTFKPSLSSIGVKWTTLTEVTLDTSLNLSAEELLVDYSSQAIRTALDIRAFRYAYGIAKTNAKHNPNYCYHFDAAYNTQSNVNNADGTVTTQGAKDPYIANAATFVNAIDAVGDTIYDEFNYMLRFAVQKYAEKQTL